MKLAFFYILNPHLVFSFMEKSDWFATLEKVFQQEKFSGLNFRYYQPGPFLQIARKVEKYKDECPECSEFTETITETFRLLNKETKVSDSTKMKYSQLFREITSHLKKKHHLNSPGINTSLFTLIGMVAGFSFWFLIRLIFGHDTILINLRIDFLLATFIGLVIGRVAGKRRDRKLRQRHQTLY